MSRAQWTVGCCERDLVMLLIELSSPSIGWGCPAALSSHGWMNQRLR